MAVRFVGYPDAYMHATPGGKKINHKPWGYFIDASTVHHQDGFTRINYRWRDDNDVLQPHAWVRTDRVQANRLLELNFVDVGQGDGCFLVFPDDTRMLIDAGISDNMYRFLRWRFNLRNNPSTVAIDTVAVTHPDKDHYNGVDPIATDAHFAFGRVVHNGIVERSGPDAPLGPREPVSGGDLLQIVETPAQLSAIVSNPALRGGRFYPNLMEDLRASARVGPIQGLSHDKGHVPGFAPGDQLVIDEERPTIEVLGPIGERDAGRLRFPWFGGVGKTKNGHSLVFKLSFGNFSALLGGDLNARAERYLLEQHTGLDSEPDTADAREALIQTARATFECDVMKACHHGSGDFEELFIESANPVVTIVSSGDDESWAHPRPDTLGALGKYARGTRPLIFSTELARSTREQFRTPDQLRDAVDEQIRIFDDDNATDEDKEAAREQVERLTARLERAVAVYGMISVHTDGENAIVFQKLERPNGNQKWDIHRLEPDGAGRMRYVADD